MNIRIEPFNNCYKNQVIHLISLIQQQEFGINITPAQQPDLHDIERVYQQDNGNFWISLDDDMVVGTIGLLDIGNQEGALRKMFVRKDVRGTGIAKQLLDTLLLWARAQGISAIYLGTTSAFHAAHRFYAKHGFVEIPKSELPRNFPVMEVDTKFYRYSVHR